MKEIKTVALIGLGAIGSFLASSLQPVLGDSLRIIADGARAERIRQNGILVNGRRVDFRVAAPTERMDPADLAIFITKMTGLEQAAADMKNQVGPETLILSPLNGVESEEALAKTYGWENILYSLVRCSVVMEGNRISYNPNLAKIEYGEKTGGDSPRVAAIRALFDRAGLVSVNPADMQRAIWEKFVCNVSENQVSAVLGIPFGAWGASEHANALRETVAAEVIALARKKGIMIDENYAAEHREYLCRVPYGNISSTLQDLRHGRKTEVAMFAGTVVRLGREEGIPTPCNEFLYHAIRVLEEKNDGSIRAE